MSNFRLTWTGIVPSIHILVLSIIFSYSSFLFHDDGFKEKGAVRLQIQSTLSTMSPIIYINTTANQWVQSSDLFIRKFDEHRSYGKLSIYDTFYNAFYTVDHSKAIRDMKNVFENDFSSSLDSNSIETLFADSTTFKTFSIHPSEIIDHYKNSALIKDLKSLQYRTTSESISMTMQNGRTPCKLINGHQSFIQLHGESHFILFPPERTKELLPYPYLHPAHNYCQTNLSQSSNYKSNAEISSAVDWRKWNNTIEVLLKAGELLYVPPYWLVESITRSPLVVQLSIISDIPDDFLLQQILAMEVPGLTKSVSTVTDKVIAMPPLLPIATDTLQTICPRLVLAAAFILDVLYSALGRNNGARVIYEVYTRYQPLVADGSLPSLSAELLKPYVRLLGNWIPRPPQQAFVGWSTWMADSRFGDSCLTYVKTVVKLIKVADRVIDRTELLTSFVEATALLVTGEAEAASLLINAIGELSAEILRIKKKTVQ